MLEFKKKLERRCKSVEKKCVSEYLNVLFIRIYNIRGTQKYFLKEIGVQAPPATYLYNSSNDKIF